MFGKKYSTKWTRLLVVVGLATPVGLAISAGSGDAALDFDDGGANVGQLTRFQIDGDPVPGLSSNTSNISADPNVVLDWDIGTTPYPPQGVSAAAPPLGLPSTGLLPLTFADVKVDDYPRIDPAPNPQFPSVPGQLENCGDGADDNWNGGTKVDSLVNIDDPLEGPGDSLNLGCGQVLNKGNLFSAYTAYEIVTVPDTYGVGAPGGQNETVIYGAWERDGVPGEINFYVPISDAVAGNSSGDRLIAFDYDSSAPASFRVLKWDVGTSTWIVDTAGDVNTDPALFQAEVGFVDGSDFTSRPSFGEFALNLSATGILPSDADAECVSLRTSGYIFTETGNSPSSAQLKDFVGAPSLPISNCGSLAVTKAGPAGVTPAPDFDYIVEQRDSAAIFPTSATQISEQIQIDETDTWTGVFAQPDYVVFEPAANLPPGWEQVSVDCTYIDQFTLDFPTVTNNMFTGNVADLGNPEPSVFLQVQSDAFLEISGNVGFVPSCTITNAAAGVIIAKETVPDGSSTAFPFTIAGAGGSTPASLADGEEIFVPFTAGTTVTITENLGSVTDTPGWTLTDITCENDDGAEIDLGAGTATISSGDASTTVKCTYTNTQNASIVVDKTGLPADSTEPFDFTITGPSGPYSIDDLTIAGAASAAQEVAPGNYVVTELEPPLDDDWALTAIDCGDFDTSVNLDTQEAFVTLPAGAQATCVFTNMERGDLSITKTAELIQPAPVADTVNQFDVRYTVTATSTSQITEDITVVDAFAFPAAITVVGTPTVGGAAAEADWNGDDKTLLFDGTIGPLGELVWTIDVRVEVNPDALSLDRNCGESGKGTWNNVTLNFYAGVREAAACRALADPTIHVEKDVVGSVTVNADKSMTVAYEIDVINTGEGPGIYDLDDEFGFPAWVTVTGVTVANTAPGTIAVENGTFDGVANTDITTSVAVLGGGASHTYTVTVDFTAAPTADNSGVICGEGPGTGLFNLASVTSTSGDSESSACINIPRGQLEVTKATFGDTGSFAIASDVPGDLINGASITTTIGDGTASGETLSAWVTPGSYEVTETAPAGWTAISEPCGPGSEAVVVDEGSASCDFENGKQGSITVTKTATPAGTFDFALAPGDTQSVDSGGPGYTWSALDAGDYTLTEEVPENWDLLSAICGETVIENGGTIALAWGEDVTCNFVNDLDLADMAIVKTAEVSRTIGGNSFDWVLDVTNNGPADAENIVVGDLVPAAVTVTGVSSSDFDCSFVGNDVTCLKDGMDVGETGQITITVSVPSDAAAGEVVNLGTVASETPDSDLSNNSDDASVIIDVIFQEPPVTTVPPVTVAPILPPTGSNSTFAVTQAALLLFLLGGGVVLITRRRRREGDLG